VIDMTQAELYQRFRALHLQDGGFVMPNAWDGASALLMKKAGFQALGTSSAAFAFSLGRLDGIHAVGRQEEIDNAVLIGKLTGLPVNGDFEDGFGPSPEDCALTIEASIAAGLAGVGIEDTTGNPDKPVHDFDHAVARVRAAARVAKGRVWLTGRTDNFLHGRNDLDDTIKRLVAFAEVGADVVYAPFPPDMDAIKKIIAAVAPTPVNVLIGPASGPVPLAELRATGVKRVSLGAALYTRLMLSLQDGLESLNRGDIGAAAKGLPPRQIAAMIKEASAS
jgi:2-methylisocitrate lyase-like PEP mutase family enzyme